MIDIHIPTREELTFEVLSDGRWHTLKELAEKTGFPEASVSCSIRTLRKPDYGRFSIEKEYDATNRVYLYRMTNAPTN